MTGNDVQVAEPRRSRRRWVIAGAVVGVLAVLAAVVLVVFQPQRLLFDDEVDEAIPTATTPDASTAPGDPVGPTAPAPVPERTGSFVSLAHGTDGQAQILTVGAQRYLRIEDLDTDNGPDLHVYLTSTPAAGDEDTFDDDFIELGALKGNVGNQNYELPADVDLSRHGTVVIWCDRFDVAFGAADLT